MGAINNTSDGSTKNENQLGMDDKFDEFDPSSQTETSTSTATKIRQQLLLNYDDLGPNDTE
jgi:D-alanyl-D-alanine dipeptidase